MLRDMIRDGAGSEVGVGPVPSASPRIVAVLALFTRSAAVSVTAVSTLVLIFGWASNVAALRSLVPHSGLMRPYAAVGLVLLGVCLWCAGSAGSAGRRMRRIAAVCATAVLSIGVLAVLENIINRELLREQTIFRQMALTFGGAHPGRLGVGPAVCLILVAASHLALLDGSRRAVMVGQILALATVLTGLIASDNLLHNRFEGASERIGGGWAAPLTTMGITLVALGTVAARPQGTLIRAMVSDTVAGGLGRWMLLATVTVPFVSGWVPALAGRLGLSERRFAALFLLTASLAVFSAASFVATAAGARIEAASIQAGRATRQGHAQLLALIDNTSAVIYIRDLDGRYLLANREYERLFSVERDRIVGLTDHELFPKDIADASRANDLRALAARTPVVMEEGVEQQDGLHTYVTVKFRLTDDTGDPYAVCGISTDITDRKRAEDQVQLLNSELELRVQDRTEELEASARELEAFAYSVSHDLRAPLRTVDGFGQILLDDYADRIDEQGQDYLRRMRAGTQRMGGLIDDLLKLSRTTRAELRRERVDLTELAWATMIELRDADPGRDVRVTIENGLLATGDRSLLRLVMENLLSNAWKFTGKRADARIEVSAAPADDGQQAFQVHDNGAGFDMRYIAKLFGVFERLHNAADFAGNGVGLATVQRIVQRHGGEVRAESEPGKGATFTFTLPSRLPAEVGARSEQSR